MGHVVQYAMSDLPDDFNEASDEMMVEFLKRLRGDELATMICEEVGIDSPRSAQLNKDQKAAILLELKRDN